MTVGERDRESANMAQRWLGSRNTTWLHFDVEWLVLPRCMYICMYVSRFSSILPQPTRTHHNTILKVSDEAMSNFLHSSPV